MRGGFDSADLRHLSGAEGWLELGDAREADAEWQKLSRLGRAQPDALELRWHILARMADWERAVQVGEELVARSPDRSSGWLHRAYALRRASPCGLQQAWEALHPAADRFPDIDIIAYNLACYATQLGRLDDGWEWLLRALQVTEDGMQLRRMALRDEDLKPLWSRIQAL